MDPKQYPILKLLPFQLIETPKSLILKRGLRQIVIEEKENLTTIKNIQEILMDQPQTVIELALKFAQPERPKIINLLTFLIEKKFLVDANDHLAIHDQSPEQIFYWQFNTSLKEVNSNINTGTIYLIGVNELNLRIFERLSVAEFKDIKLVDDPILRSTKYFNSKGEFTTTKVDSIPISKTDFTQSKLSQNDLVIGGSEFGSQFLLLEWNLFSLKKEVLFLPVVLQNLVGSIGPLVVPNQTPCLHCLRSRQNSHMDNFEEKRIAEKFAFDGQLSNAYHPSLLHIFSELVSFEVIRMKNPKLRGNLIGKVLEFNIINSTLQSKKILKVPRCEACSKVNQYPIKNIDKKLATTESWEKLEKMGSE